LIDISAAEFDPIHFFVEHEVVRAGNLPFRVHGFPKPTPTPTP
jgi:hypothetical protein